MSAPKVANLLDTVDMCDEVSGRLRFILTIMHDHECSEPEHRGYDLLFVREAIEHCAARLQEASRAAHPLPDRGAR